MSIAKLLGGPGFWILNGFRFLNIVAITTAGVGAIYLLAKTQPSNGGWFVFDAITHLLTAIFAGESIIALNDCNSDILSIPVTL